MVRHCARTPQARAYFFQPGGEAWPVGHRLRNPALAEVLRVIARDGSRGLHEGPVAADVVRRVQAHARSPGSMSLEDLRGYQSKKREPICTDWTARWRVCGFPPPSSGHLTIMQILGMLEQRSAMSAPLESGVPASSWLHTYTEAARLAFADRAQYVADPDFVVPPGGDWKTLLAPSYLRQRAALIGDRSMGTATAGKPAPVLASLAPQADQPEHGTSHISIVDAEGRVLAMTTTIEAVWGSRIMSDGGSGKPGGFMLNNQLTDFSALPADGQGRPIANRVQGGKRPRSSMSPTLVFDRSDGRLVMSIGSPGGAAIIHFTAKTLIGALDWGLDVQRAIDLPNFGSFNGPTVLEAGRFPAATVDALRQRGHKVVETDLASGLQGLQRRGTGWFGGADPRREGIVIGD
jgi:gamma-glutamyltranspeptidase/glutathione hydrolase